MRRLCSIGPSRCKRGAGRPLPQAPATRGLERPQGPAGAGRWASLLRRVFTRGRWSRGRAGTGAPDSPAGIVGFHDDRADAWPGDGSRLEAVGAWLGRQVAIEAARRSGFHVLPVALIAGAAAVFALDWRPDISATILAAAVIGALALRAVAHPMLQAMLLGVAGILAGALLSLADGGATRTTIISGTATTRIAGTIFQASRDEKGRMRYLVAVTGTVRPVLSRPPERVRILVSADHAARAPGDAYYGLVRLGPPSGPAAPGSHDFAYQPFFDGVGALGFALGAPDAEPAEGLLPPPPPGFVDGLAIRLERIRGTMTRRITEAAGGGEAGAIAAALVTGERTGIPDDAETWLRGVGLAHVLSISGLHLAIVAGSALLLLRSGLALVPALALNYPVKKIAAVVALLVAALYLLLSGGNVATQRAFVMLAVMLAAVIADRPALTLRNVSIAALVVVVAAPHSVTTASFQMSFAATLSLVAGYGAIMRRRGGAKAPPAGQPLAWRLLAGAGATILGIVVSSLVAGAATAPFAAYHFHRVAPFGLVANVLTLPIFTMVVMPLGLVGSLLMPFGLDGWCFRLMGLSLDLVLWVSEWLFRILPDRGTGPISGTGVVFLTAALFAASFFASKLRYIAVPLAIAGLLTIRDTSDPPQLVVYEDGRTIAAFAGDGAIAYLARRPKRFVTDQWERSFGVSPAAVAASPAAVAPHVPPAYSPAALPTPPAEPLSPTAAASPAMAHVPLQNLASDALPPAVAMPPGSVEATSSAPAPSSQAVDGGFTTGEPTSPADSPTPQMADATSKAAVATPRATAPVAVAGSTSSRALPDRSALPCDADFCRFTTRDGLRIVWTSDYKRTGEACDGGDVAIVARAIRLEHCRSGALLVTLRTLRATGSLALYRDPATGRPILQRSIAADPPPWNRHRLAPWPEYWRKPAADEQDSAPILQRPGSRAEPPAPSMVPPTGSAAEALPGQAPQ